jgi:hypothetical protein
MRRKEHFLLRVQSNGLTRLRRPDYPRSPLPRQHQRTQLRWGYVLTAVHPNPCHP